MTPKKIQKLRKGRIKKSLNKFHVNSRSFQFFIPAVKGKSVFIPAVIVPAVKGDSCRKIEKNMSKKSDQQIAKK